MKKKESLAKNSAILFVLTTLGSVLNYGSQLLMGRFFSITNYGIINTIFSLILIVSVLGNTSSMLLSKTIAEDLKNAREISYKILKIVNISCIVLAIVFCFMIPILKNIITNNYIVIVLTILCLITSIYPIVFQGVLGGLQKFIKLGMYTLIIPVTKLLGLIFISFLSLNGEYELYIILSSIILGNILSIIIGVILIQKLDDDEESVDIFSIWKSYKLVLYANVYLMVLMNIDILYLSTFESKRITGLYSSVLMFGKMVYYCVTAIVTVMLPMISKNKKDKSYVNNILSNTIIFTIIFSILLLIPVNIFGQFFIKIIYGIKYLEAVKYLKYSSLISVSYSINLILLNYLVGVNKIEFIKNTMLIGILVLMLLLLIFRNITYISLLLIFIVNLIIFVLNVFYIIKQEIM